jgi:hypothetical protein
MSAWVLVVFRWISPDAHTGAPSGWQHGILPSIEADEGAKNIP